MLKSLMIMLCCTAQELSKLCSLTDVMIISDQYNIVAIRGIIIVNKEIDSSSECSGACVVS